MHQAGLTATLRKALSAETLQQVLPWADIEIGAPWPHAGPGGAPAREGHGHLGLRAGAAESTLVAARCQLAPLGSAPLGAE